jgi:hypothetical protein
MSPRLVRVLVLAALAVPVALLLSPAQAQFGRPGGRLPRPPIPPGRMPGGGLTQHEWVCSGCGKVLGRGAVKPIMPKCPFCGVKFSNGMDIEIDRPGFPRRGGRGNVPPTNPQEEPPPPADNEQPPPADNPAAPANNNFVPPPAAAEPVAESGTSSATRAVLIAAAAGGGFLFLFAAVGTCLYVFAARAAKPDVPQRRRKRVYHDEDD